MSEEIVNNNAETPQDVIALQPGESPMKRFSELFLGSNASKEVTSDEKTSESNAEETSNGGQEETSNETEEVVTPTQVEEEVTETSVEEEKEDSPEPEAEEKEAVKPSTSLVRVTLPNGEVMEVPADGLVELKVDGKTIKASIADLKKTHSVETYFTKRSQQMAEKERAAAAKTREAESRIALQDSYLKDIHKEITEKKNVLGAINQLCQLPDTDPSDVMQSLVSQSLAISDKWKSMTENERTQWMQGIKLQFTNEKLSKEVSAARAKEERTQNNAVISKFIADHDLDTDIFKQGWEALKEKGYSQEGKPITEICKDVTNYILDMKHLVRVKMIAEKQDPSFVGDNRAVEDLAALCPKDFSDQDILDIVKGVIDEPETKPTSSKPPAKAVPAKSKEAATKTTSAQADKVPKGEVVPEFSADDGSLKMKYEDFFPSLKRKYD